MRHAREIAALFGCCVLLGALLLWAGRAPEKTLDPEIAARLDNAHPIRLSQLNAAYFDQRNLRVGHFHRNHFSVSPNLEHVVTVDIPNAWNPINLTFRRWPAAQVWYQLSLDDLPQRMLWTADSKILYIAGTKKIYRLTIAQNEVKIEDFEWPITVKDKGKEQGDSILTLHSKGVRAVATYFHRDRSEIRFVAQDVEQKTKPQTWSWKLEKTEVDINQSSRWTIIAAPVGNNGRHLIATLQKLPYPSNAKGLTPFSKVTVGVFDSSTGTKLWSRPFSGESVQAQFTHNSEYLVLMNFARTKKQTYHEELWEDGLLKLDAITGKTQFVGDTNHPFGSRLSREFTFFDGQTEFVWFFDSLNRLNFADLADLNSKKVLVPFDKNQIRANSVTPQGDGQVWIFDSDKGVKPIRREDLGRWKKRLFGQWR